MRCYARRHDVNGVRKVYRTLVEALQRELGQTTEAAVETDALLRELTGRPGGAA